VYLIKEGNLHKIGWTANPYRRFSELTQQSPQQREYVLMIESEKPELAESFWKNRFSEKNVKGEWFALTTHDVSMMKKIKKM
jgi:hypothetical protein